ncbi:ATP synthase subunit alpha [Acrasis kona]|uniref:ATP synthase subunit alpha n=1 Tax=Acrasis kona TaxID=1008807 RepID=A0AAW2ZMM9_9EUKA
MFSNLHWAVNDMSPRNMSPRAQSVFSTSPRPSTPTKRNFEEFRSEQSIQENSHKDINQGGESLYNRSVRARTVSDATNPYLSRNVMNNHLISSSLPNGQDNMIYSNTVYDKVLSPQNEYQFSLFGQDTESTAIQSFLSDDNMTEDLQFHQPLNQPLQVDQTLTPSGHGQRPAMDLSPVFNLQEFRMNSNDPLAMSEPSLFDFDSI